MTLEFIGTIKGNLDVGEKIVKLYGTMKSKIIRYPMPQIGSIYRKNLMLVVVLTDN